MTDYIYNIVSSVFRDCYEKNKSYVSNFLTTEEQNIYLQEAKKYPTLTLIMDGGMKNAEYQKAIIKVSDREVDREISVLKITYNPRYLSLTHRNILGSLIHLGIKRDRIGDILVQEGVSYVAVCSNLVPFIQDNLTTIHNQEVVIKEIFEEIELEDKGVEKTLFLQSVRLDSVIANAYNISREDSLELIKRELVKVNQKIVIKAFQNLKPCDIISVAHKGRIKIIDDSATSRSGRIIMKVKIYR